MQLLRKVISCLCLSLAAYSTKHTVVQLLNTLTFRQKITSLTSYIRNRATLRPHLSVRQQSSKFRDMLSILFITLLLLANEASVKAAPPPPSDVICPADADMYKDCRASICSLIKAAPEKGPTLVRLAWHASATYTKMTNKGGSYNGTIRFPEEVSRGANNGLATAMGWLQEIWLNVRLLSFRQLAYNADTSA